MPEFNPTQAEIDQAERQAQAMGLATIEHPALPRAAATLEHAAVGAGALTLEHPALSPPTLEHPALPPTGENRLSRRHFLKRLVQSAFTGAVLGTIGGLTGRELGQESPETLVETPDAIFSLVYERHDKYIPLSEVERLGELDGYFYEYVIPRDDFPFDQNFRQILNTAMFAVEDVERHNIERQTMASQETQDYFQENGIPISFEQTRYTREFIEQSQKLKEVKDKLAATGILVLALDTGVHAVRRLKHQEPEPPSEDSTDRKKVSRRVAIKRLLAGAFGLALTPRVAEELSTFPRLHGLEVGQLQNTFDQFNALAQNLAPQDHYIFLRDLVMSFRLDIQANQAALDKPGHKPKIGVQVGSFHSHLQSVLSWPREARLQILDAYPTELLNLLINSQPAPDGRKLSAFCTTSIWQTRPEDMTGSKRGRIDLLDYELYDRLAQRLSRSD